MEGEEWETVSAEAKDLISKILVLKDKRLTAKDVLAHPWFDSVSSNQGTDPPNEIAEL